jgi:TolB-like protein/Tfp pilus assembly protein PilF
MQRIYCFEGLTLDLHRGCLTSAEGERMLRPKSFEVLRHLVENAGRLVSKQELVSVVWPQVSVNDDSLARCVSEVRLAIGDRQQRIIKTLPRRGYRFVVPVESRSLSAPIADRPLPGVARAEPFPPSLDRASIAVLHFARNSPDPAQDYLAEGLSEDLITSLSKFSDLFVIARHSAFSFKDRDCDAARIGRELGARYLLSGSVRRDGERIRVTAQLVDSVSDRELWAQTYDRPFTSVFGLQDELTQKIVATLVVHLKQTELARSLRKAPGNLAAYDYFLRGNALLKNRAGADRGRMVAEARSLLKQAVDADPYYAPAVQGLAEAYLIIWLERSGYAPLAAELRNPATLERARSLAQQALQIDPFLAEAHATLGWTLHWQYRRQEGLAEFEKARALNPNLADGRYAHALMQVGRAAEAVEFMQRALLHDPFPPAMHLSWLGNSYYLLGRYDDAFATLSIGAERMPDYPSILVWLAAAAARVGRHHVARDAAARIMRQQPDFSIASWLDFIRLEPDDAANLNEGLRCAGLPD